MEGEGIYEVEAQGELWGLDEGGKKFYENDKGARVESVHK